MPQHRVAPTALMIATWLVLSACVAHGQVGRGARLFITKCYPRHGKLNDADFRQLADAGFTVVVNKWPEDVPAYCRGAGRVGLDAMVWMGGLWRKDGMDQTITRRGKPTRYARPWSPAGWEEMGQRICDQARISRDYGNHRGVILDFEIYDKNKTDGFCESYDDESFTTFLRSAGQSVPAPLTDPAGRQAYLKDKKLLRQYMRHQYELVLAQVKRLRKKLDEINPRFQVGVYGWGALSGAVMEGFATHRAPALFISAMTYGRTQFSRAFSGGYDGNEPCRTGLRWSQTVNARIADAATGRNYPVIMLCGHYPQSPGPADGTQYKFTARQAFNSAAYGNGYWIWTDWSIKKSWQFKSKQEWIDAMMAYFAQANAALDAGDWTWSSRQKDSVADLKATTPMRIVTRGGKALSIWDPLTGRKAAVGDLPDPDKAFAHRVVRLDGKVLRINGSCLELVEPGAPAVAGSFPVGHGARAVAVGDVDAVAGPEVVTLNAGWIKIWDPESRAQLLRFFVGADQTEMTLVP